MTVDVVNLASLFNVDTLLLMALATLAGIVIGALPGLTATMAVSLMVSLTYGMEARNALAILIALYLGGIYGGSRSAILLNVPGTPSSAATALEGFPLTQQGKGSISGIVGYHSFRLWCLSGSCVLGLRHQCHRTVCPEFGSWEYFWLAIFGIIISGNIAGVKPYKASWPA